MRIGLLTTSYPRHDSDVAGRFVAELAGALADGDSGVGDDWGVGGDAVEVIAPAPACNARRGVTLYPVRYYLSRPALLHGAGAPDNLFGAGPLADRARALAQIPPYLAGLLWTTRRRQRGWDAVISHWLLPSAAAAAIAAPELPHLAVAHSSDVHLLSRLPRPLGAALLSLIAGPRTALVLTSEHLRPLLAAVARTPAARRLIGDATVQPMGIPLPPPADPVAVARLRAQQGLSGREVVLFVGRLVPVKGVDRLLRAAARVARPLTVAVVGDGPEREALDELAAELGVDVRFVGVQTGAAKQTWYAAADLLALPSVVLPDGRTDSAPVVLLEAMAAGLPVVASEVGGVRDLVGDGGTLVPSGDVAALGRALEAKLTALADPTARAEASARATRHARRFGWDRVAPALRQRLVRPAQTATHR